MPLTKKTPLSTWIDDFVHSDAPQFAGKSRAERINMAKGAFYGKQNEEVIVEGRPSQQHPIEGHAYHSKTNDQLNFIMKDAGEAAIAMRGHSPQSENKYLDQVNDASTVLGYRRRAADKSGEMPNWYKKKYSAPKATTVVESEELQEAAKSIADHQLHIVFAKAMIAKQLAKGRPTYALERRIDSHMAAIKKMKRGM